MKLSSIASLAVFAAILGSGLFLGRDLTRARIPAPAPLPAEAEAPPPRSTLLEKGDWYLAHGDLDRAAEAFEEAAEFAPSIEEAKAGLREVGEQKRQACLGNMEKLGELLAWLDRQELKGEAEEVARLIVKLDKSNAPAHRRLGHELYEGMWFEKDQMDLVAVAKEFNRRAKEMEGMTPRQQKVYLVKDDIRRRFGDHCVFQDCGPAAPWLLGVEASEVYDATLRLEEFASALDTLYAEFTRDFPGVFNPARLAEDAILIVYAFDGPERYRRLGKGRLEDLSHFDQESGQVYLTAARQSTLESLFHEGTHQLVHSILLLHKRDFDLKEGRVALWTSAGLACRMEGFKRDSDGNFVFDGLSRDYALPAREAIESRTPPVTLRDVIRFRFSDLWAARRIPGESMRMDALCWSAVYFFMDGAGGKRRKDFLGYCAEEWKSGVGIEGAENRLGKLDALDAEWKEFVLGLK